MLFLLQRTLPGCVKFIYLRLNSISDVSDSIKTMEIWNRRQKTKCIFKQFQLLWCQCDIQASEYAGRWFSLRSHGTMTCMNFFGHQRQNLRWVCIWRRKTKEHWSVYFENVKSIEEVTVWNVCRGIWHYQLMQKKSLWTFRCFSFWSHVIWKRNPKCGSLSLKEQPV